MRGISLMVEGKMRCFGGAQHDMRERVIFKLTTIN